MNMLFISKDDDYSYIDKFIDYLERLINIILKLFRSSDADDDTTTSTQAAASEA